MGWNGFLHLITEVYLCNHHQMEAQAEEQAAEAQKERKLRERNEQYSRQLEEELEGLKVTEHEPVHRRVSAHPEKFERVLDQTKS